MTDQTRRKQLDRWWKKIVEEEVFKECFRRLIILIWCPRCCRNSRRPTRGGAKLRRGGAPTISRPPHLRWVVEATARWLVGHQGRRRMLDDGGLGREASFTLECE